MNYIITGKNYNSSLFSKLNNVKIISEEELNPDKFELTYEDKLYSANETSLGGVIECLRSDKRISEIQSLKDKYKCRQLMQPLYPELYFDTVKLEGIGDLELSADKKYIIKPRKGFFNTGIHEIDNETDLNQLAKKLRVDLAEGSEMFSDEVITVDEMIVEEFISGEEEYAVDMYYDAKGKPVIANIQYHPIPENKDYFFVLHYSSLEINKKYYGQLMEIFETVNKTLDAKNLPIHAEFKDVEGKLVPIEFNVLRFGGFGFGDIAYRTLGINSFSKYFKGEEIDMIAKSEDSPNQYFGMFLCYLPKVDYDFLPDHEKMKEFLGDDLLHYVEMDYNKNPVFAISYFSTNSRNRLQELLEVDFERFVIEK
jgi:hypothetical protein